MVKVLLLISKDFTQTVQLEPGLNSDSRENPDPTQGEGKKEEKIANAMSIV